MTVFQLLSIAALGLAGLNSLLILWLWRALSRERGRMTSLNTTTQRLEREMGQHRYAMAMLRRLQGDMPGEAALPAKTDEQMLDEAVATLDQVAGLAHQDTQKSPETALAEPARKTDDKNLTQASLAGLKDEEILQFVRKAVTTNSISLHYQPIVTLPGRATKYYEVFARILVNGGYIAAKDFVSVARSHNLIAAIDNILLLRCLQLLKKNPGIGNAELFINVSAQTFSNKKYMDDLIQFLSANPKLSSRLVFEMTQQDSISMNATVRSVMEGLSLLGCRFSMDQVTIFGIDMNRLADQHMSFIKLDINAVIREMDNLSGRKRFRKIKNTLDSQGVVVILEKVENEKQLLNIIDLHADYGQGYLFGAPQSA